MVSADLTTLKTMPTTLTSSLICSGSYCLNSTDVKLLRYTLYGPYSEPDVNSTVETLAGASTFFADGPGVSAIFNGIFGIDIASNGTLYVADTGGHVIRAVSPSGVVSTIAGAASAIGSQDGPALSARFNAPYDVAVHPNGTLYISEINNNCIRSISPSGVVSTVATSIMGPRGIGIAPNGTLYVAEFSNHRIRAISPSGVLTTVAGSTSGFTDGSSSVAKFNNPSGVFVAPNGTIYVTEYNNHAVRVISTSGDVSTLTGTSVAGSANGAAVNATFRNPHDQFLHANGTLYITDFNNHLIRAVFPNRTVATVAGVSAGNLDGQGTAARVNKPAGLVFAPNGTMYFTDNGNSRVRAMSPSGYVSTIAGNTSVSYVDGQGESARFYIPQGIAVAPNGTVYVADSGNHLIRSISPSGEVRTVAGATTSGYADGQGTTARFYYPSDVFLMPNGTLYVSDTWNNRIRAISPSGMVTTVAGTGATTPLTNGPAVNATFNRPMGLSLSSNGTLYIAEEVGGRVRALSPNGTVSTVATGFINSRSVLVHPNGTVYVTDTVCRISSISPSGTISILAGGACAFADGQGTAARFNYPSSLALSRDGTLYVSDTINNRIRAISETGYVSTIAGGLPGHADGIASSSMLNRPRAIALSSNGTMYVADTDNHRIRVIKPQF